LSIISIVATSSAFTIGITGVFTITTTSSAFTIGITGVFTITTAPSAFTIGITGLFAIAIAATSSAFAIGIGLFTTTSSIAALSPLVSLVWLPFALRAVTVFIEEPTTLGAMLWAASTALTVTFTLLLIALRRRGRSIDWGWL
jgi:hypothetical protein